jgi:sugar/nucleoside kinase (ribokinase family)
MSLYDVSVLGFGDNVVDKYVHIKTMYPGGNCVNYAAYANMLGVKRSAYMGYFGNDAAAEHVINTLDRLNIETVKCKQFEDENGWSEITIKDGDRVFLDWNDGGVRGRHPYVLDRFDLQYIKQFDVVHSGNYCYTEKELHKIQQAGVPLSFDFSDDSSQEYYEQVAPNVDYAFMSCSGQDEEAVQEHLEFVKKLGPKLAVATLGAKGAMAFDGSKFYRQNAAPLEKIVDTMGAGDSFITAFMVCYIFRLKQHVEQNAMICEAMESASKFAARICQLEGAFGFGKKYE